MRILPASAVAKRWLQNILMAVFLLALGLVGARLVAASSSFAGRALLHGFTTIATGR
ncbi:Uncharacterised protein [Serratia fonticola]|uniref:Uncharacterized protein n=1 Tax=Serratia fonticola TaxID=47917 RepID=A0A4U9V9Q0_SERFO|nr:Uncharacterised protein [Serratia fonticola]